MAPGIDELAREICVDFSIEYAAAKDRGIVRSLFLSNDTRGYLAMIDARDTPYANAIARLEALAVSDPQVSADAQRLIVALDEARQANAEYVEDNMTARRFADAMTGLEDVADELGLASCGNLKIAEKS